MADLLDVASGIILTLVFVVVLAAVISAIWRSGPRR